MITVARCVLPLLMAGSLLLASSATASSCLQDQRVVLGGESLQLLDIERMQPVWKGLHEQGVFEPVCLDNAVYAGSRGGLTRLDRRSGRPDWQLDFGADTYPPVVDGEALYVATADGRLRKLARTDGRVLWQHDFPGWVYPPARLGDVLLVGGGFHAVYALHRGDGRVLWQRPIGQELVYRPVAAADDGLFLLTSYRPGVTALAAADGQQRWRRDLPGLAYTPALADGVAYVGRRDGVLSALAVASGRELWHARLDGTIRALPALSDLDPDVLWIGTERGSLYALRRHDGQVLFHRELPTPLIDTPFRAPDGVLVRGHSGRIFAIALVTPTQEGLTHDDIHANYRELARRSDGDGRPAAEPAGAGR